jgi:hypothetical protein
VTYKGAMEVVARVQARDHAVMANVCAGDSSGNEHLTSPGTDDSYYVRVYRMDTGEYLYSVPSGM